MSRIKAWIKAVYRLAVDHLTKLLGLIGTAITSVMLIDPDPIRAAASQYLDGNAAHKIYLALFVLVILRGWYTGNKAKKP